MRRTLLFRDITSFIFDPNKRQRNLQSKFKSKTSKNNVNKETVVYDHIIFWVFGIVIAICFIIKYYYNSLRRCQISIN